MEKKEISKLRNDETTVFKPVLIFSTGHYKWMIMQHFLIKIHIGS